MKALLGLVFALALVVSCAAKPHEPNVSGLVDIGGGRWLYLDCRGSGWPTVFIVPGKGSYAETWNVVVPAVANTTRVCAYDRPNTRLDGSDRSTPIAQPHSVRQAVGDVVELIAAARLSAPMVVVGHSYGGLIADLLARTHPALVSGLVFVDPTSEYLPRLGRADQDAVFDEAARAPTPDPEGEGFFAEDAFATIKAAPPLPHVPAIVLSSDIFPPRANVAPQYYTKFQVHRANSLLADTLWADNVIVGGSGHNMMLYQPRAVAAEIAETVHKVRSGARPR